MVTFAERVVTTFNAKKSKGKADDPITLINPAWHQVVSVYVLLALLIASPPPLFYPTHSHPHPSKNPYLVRIATGPRPA